MKILFYNHYHNGDLFVSKEFIRHIMQQLPNCEFGYYHNNNPKTIRDLLPYYGRATQSNDERFIVNGDTLTINTWIGKYIPGNYKEDPFFWNNGINYVCLYDIWKYIYSEINKIFDTDLKIKDTPEDYISTIDYRHYDISNAVKFIESRPNTKKILFSNGVPMSGQSFADDMSAFINAYANIYPQYDFICTQWFAKTASNIFFTNDVLQLQSDLNEISYLSKFCDLIVGKNSGPFIYCLERDNFTNPNKKFISFNVTREDSLDYGIKMECDYTYSNSVDGNEIFNIILNKLRVI